MKRSPKNPDQRSVTIGSKSFDAMWANLANRHQEETPPAGSMSAAQFAEKCKIPLEAARNRLNRHRRAGEVTSRLYRIRIGQCVREVMYYTPVAK